jgi:hypothetical protein
LPFVDATENLVYKQEGYLGSTDLLKEADLVLTNQSDSKPIYVLEKQYNEGKRDPDFYMSLLPNVPDTILTT